MSLMESMDVNSVLRDIEPRIWQIIRASDPDTIITVVSTLKRELQLHYLETKNFGFSK